MNQDEFRGCAKSHGRTPSAGAASGVDEETAETFQPIHERPVDARGDPGPREELTPVRVPGKLQGDAFLFRDLQLIGSVREQNPQRIDDGVHAGTRGEDKKQNRDRLFVKREAKSHCHGVCKPG